MITSCEQGGVEMGLQLHVSMDAHLVARMCSKDAGTEGCVHAGAGEDSRSWALLKHLDAMLLQAVAPVLHAQGGVPRVFTAAIMSQTLLLLLPWLRQCFMGACRRRLCPAFLLAVFVCLQTLRVTTRFCVPSRQRCLLQEHPLQ